MNELEERAYLIVDGVDGRAHHIALGRADLSELPVGGIVDVRATPVRVADRNISATSREGMYSTSQHRGELRNQGISSEHATDVVDGHVRRLEALRRAKIVERTADGLWRVPADLVQRGHAYDQRRTGGIEVQLRSRLPVERQVTAMGETWLDRTLVNKDVSPASAGFGAIVKDALSKRKDFLVEHGFATRNGDAVIGRRDLLTALRQQDLEGVAAALSKETGKPYRPPVDGQRSHGIYAQTVTTTSGRFAMLDDGLGFSLVPWRPVLERRMGQQLSAMVHGDQVAWSFGRERGLSR